MRGRFSSGSVDPGALIRTALPIALLVAGTFAISQGVATARVDRALTLALGAAIFIVAFLKTEFGLYVVILSMLLSPEFGGTGGSTLAEGRSIVLRTEDFLLIVIAFSWLAKTALNKELGLVLKTPLNRPIAAYVGATTIATAFGYLTGTVRTGAGFFYVLKYVEYFFVYYMVVNNVTDRDQVRRFVGVAFLTAAIASLIGIGQIPSGKRVSAPFEVRGEEPNTFGGYLLFMIALLLGVALETRSFKVRAVSLGLAGLFTVPFAFTLSRASYLGFIPMLLVVGLMSRRRQFMLGLLLVLIIASPFLVYFAPQAVSKRIAYTFEPEAGQPTVRVGTVGLDPSTSVRLLSTKHAFEGWQQRPILGFGVTGFGFMDQQYARTLVETGVMGLAAFLWLAVTVLRSGLNAYRSLADPNERGLALGFVAGAVGLLTHAVGANTFIIVRIMEPFWLFAGIVVMLPLLQEGEKSVPARAVVPRLVPARLRPS